MLKESSLIGLILQLNVDLQVIRILSCVYSCMRRKSPLINFTARHGIIYGQIGNILNCSFRYNIRLEEILALSVT